MLLLQICFTSCHVGGILAECFTWLVIVQSLGVDLPNESLEPFTSASCQVYSGSFNTPMAGLIF